MLMNSIFRDCVVFLGIKKDDVFQPRATGFIVSVSDHGTSWNYIVTSEHVISKLLDAKQELFVSLAASVDSDIGQRGCWQ